MSIFAYLRIGIFALDDWQFLLNRLYWLLLGVLGVDSMFRHTQIEEINIDLAWSKNGVDQLRF